MPLGKYKDFASCHSSKMREGLSSAAADRYCGALQQQIEGASSQETKSALDGHYNMSQQQEQRPDKPEDSGKVTMTMAQAEQLANAVFNDDLEGAKRILTDIMNIEKEDSPPQQGPPR